MNVLRARTYPIALLINNSFCPLEPIACSKCADVDVIHIHGHRHLLNNIALRHSQSQNCPVVMTANGTLRRLESRQRIKWLWDRLIAGHVPQQVDHCITVSSADTAIHRAAGIPSRKDHPNPQWPRP